MTDERYPEYPTFEFSEPIKVPKDAFQEALRKVSSAIVMDSVRPMFMFVRFHDGKLIATDGSRLHQADFPYGVEALVPSRAITELNRRLRSVSSDHFLMEQTGNQFIFGLDGDCLIAAKHVDAYPDVEGEMIRPALAHRYSATVSAKELKQAISRAALTADSDTSYIGFTISNNKVSMSCTDKFGNVSYECVPTQWSGSERRLGVNYRYLKDVLSAMKDDQLTINFGSDNPPRLSSLCFKEEGFLAVLVQLRSDLAEIVRSAYASRIEEASRYA